MPHHHKLSPLAQEWAQARDTVAKLILEVDYSLESINTARQNLVWKGGSERYFQWQVGRQHYYLTNQRDYLQQLHDWLDMAVQHPGEIKMQPLATPTGNPA